MTTIPKLPECVTVFLCGPVSSGKSWLLEQWLRGMERSCFVDTAASLIGKPDFEHISSPDIFAKRLEENQYYYRIAYHPIDIAQEFDWIARAMWVSEKPRWLIMDEVQMVCGTTVSPMMKLICQVARHDLLGFIGAAQRIADVDKALTNAARMVILFYTAEVRDIIAIKDRWGSAMADSVTKLRPCVYNDVSKELMQSPECLVWIRGFGYKVFSLGSKIMSTGENDLWENNSQPLQMTEEDQSSPPPSGAREEKSPEDSPE